MSSNCLVISPYSASSKQQYTLTSKVWFPMSPPVAHMVEIGTETAEAGADGEGSDCDMLVFDHGIPIATELLAY
jgi:hypothetical protein